MSVLNQNQNQNQIPYKMLLSGGTLRKKLLTKTTGSVMTCIINEENAWKQMNEMIKMKIKSIWKKEEENHIQEVQSRK